MSSFDDLPPGRAPDPSDNRDPAEVWGKRIGRGLAILVAAGLILYFIWGMH